MTTDAKPAGVDETYCPSCNSTFAIDRTECPTDGTRLVRFKAQADPLIGRVLDDRFHIRAPLGEGGMGTVYRAWQQSVDREVAVKVVHPRLVGDREVARRFLREVRMGTRLQHANIIAVYDSGQTDDGLLYLVMELLRGRTLDTVMAAEPCLPLRRALKLTIQICDALEAAHAQDIIHRDLKPGNLVILDGPAGRDHLKVLDFGLAKSLAPDASRMTLTDAILGTPLYMSPEQVRGEPADHRSDLYSVGCVLYEMLTGKPPFVDGSLNLILSMHLSTPPPDLSAPFPRALRELVARLLAKEPAQRYQSATDVRSDLERILDGSTTTGTKPSRNVALDPTAAHPIIADTIPSVDVASDASHHAGAMSLPPTVPRRRRALVVASLGVVLVGAGLAIAVIASSSRAPTSRPSTSSPMPATTPSIIDAASAIAPNVESPSPTNPTPPVAEERAPTKPTPPVRGRSRRDPRAAGRATPPVPPVSAPPVSVPPVVDPKPQPKARPTVDLIPTD